MHCILLVEFLIRKLDSTLKLCVHIFDFFLFFGGGGGGGGKCKEEVGVE